MAPKKGGKKPDKKKIKPLPRRRTESEDSHSSAASESLLRDPVRDPTPPPPRSETSRSTSLSETQAESQAESQSQSRIKKARAQPLLLSKEQQEDVADWFQDNEFLYNTRHADYRNAEKRDRYFREKAGQLECTIKELETWIKSMRDRAGKLTKDSDKSGREAVKLSEKDEWIISKFGYLTKFMRRVGESKRCRVGQEPSLRCNLPEMPTAPPPRPSTPTSSVPRRRPSAAAGSAEQLLEMSEEGMDVPLLEVEPPLARPMSVASSGTATPRSSVSTADISGVSDKFSTYIFTCVA